MKSTQLLSVVLSLIMFTGVTAGGAAFADSDDYDELDDKIEDYCELSAEQQEMLLSDFPELADYAEKLDAICEIENEEEREDALEEIADVIVPETDEDDVIDSFEDCVEAGYPVMESYPEKCMVGDMVFVNDEDDDDYSDDDRYADGDKFYVCHNGKAISIAESAVRAHLAHGDSMGRCHDAVKDYDDVDRMHDKYSNKGTGNLRDHFAMYCDMTPEDRAAKIDAKHSDLPDDLREDLVRYCDMTEDEQDDFRDHMMDTMDMHYDYIKDKVHTEEEFRDKLDDYCELSDKDKAEYIAEHDKTEDKAAKMNEYCTLDEDGKTDFVSDHIDEYRAHMMDRYSDKKHHMNYDRFCSMASIDRAAEITDVAKLDRINKWCDMTPEEREEYKKKHHDEMGDKLHDKYSNKGPGNLRDRFAMYCDMTLEDRTVKMDAMHADLPDDLREDMAKYCEMSEDEQDDFRDHMMDRMDILRDHMKDRPHDKMMFSDKSDRLKAMIKSEYDISDERHDEIRMKYEERHGDLDEKKSELRIKFKEHMTEVKFRHHMTDERKSMIHDRLSEMKAFKAELREKSSQLTVEEKQQLREDFIEKAKDMQLAWISPRIQMTAGVDPAEVECREGYSLVMKASNGVAMCLKADTALKMIDRGIAVPAN